MSINSELPSLNFMEQSIQAGTASCLSNLLAVPICTCKNRQMAERNLLAPRNLFQEKFSFNRVYFSRAYHGYWAGSAVDTATFFTAYATNDYCRKNNISPFFSGVASGFTATPVIAFGEGFMSNRQVHGSSYFSFEVLRKALRLNALLVTLYREVPVTSALFWATPFISGHMGQALGVDQHSQFQNLAVETASGAIAGAAAGFMTTPFDLIKTRIQTSKEYLPILDAVKSVIDHGGWRALFNQGKLRAFYIAVAIAGMKISMCTVPEIIKTN